MAHMSNTHVVLSLFQSLFISCPPRLIFSFMKHSWRFYHFGIFEHCSMNTMWNIMHLTQSSSIHNTLLSLIIHMYTSVCPSYIYKTFKKCQKPAYMLPKNSKAIQLFIQKQSDHTIFKEAVSSILVTTSVILLAVCWLHD